jgi:hypothetical protein
MLTFVREKKHPFYHKTKANPESVYEFKQNKKRIHLFGA